MINEFIADKRKKYDKNRKRLANPAAMKKTELKLTELAKIEILDEGTGANIKNAILEDFAKPWNVCDERGLLCESEKSSS